MIRKERKRRTRRRRRKAKPKRMGNQQREKVLPALVLVLRAGREVKAEKEKKER